MMTLSREFALIYIVRLACTAWNNISFTSIIPRSFAVHYKQMGNSGLSFNSAGGWVAGTCEYLFCRV